MPTAFLDGNNNINVLFSARDEYNKSRIGVVTLSSQNPSLIIKEHENISLDLGSPGSFDDSGVMPSSIINIEGIYYLYYIGWNERKIIPYHNSIGLAISEDGLNFRRMFEGPIMDRYLDEPFFLIPHCYS